MSFCDSEDEQNILYLLQSAKLLEKLHLTVADGRSLVDVLSPSACTLKVPDLNVSLYHSRVGSLAGLCEELEAIAGRNMLEALFLEVPINTICHTVDSIGSSIQKVENVLAKPGWSALRQVSFKLTIPCAELKDHEEFTEALQSLPDKYLNHLPKNEYVSFNYSVSLRKFKYFM